MMSNIEHNPDAIGLALMAKVEPLPCVEPTPQPGPVLTCLADVEPEDVTWLWPGRFPLGKLSAISGDPGLGKSLITMDIAGCVSSGKNWPDGAENTIGAGDVLILSAEDGIADTIRPRLDATGADVSRIHTLDAIREVYDDGRNSERALCFDRDMAHLAEALERLENPLLIIVDPITAYLGQTDSHKNAKVRGVLKPLSDMAKRVGACVLTVDHLNKKSGGPAVYRSGGSIAFVAATRAAWGVCKDKEDPERRLVLPIKMNLTKDNSGLAYRVVDSPIYSGVPLLDWEPGSVHISADEAFGDEGQNGESTSALQEAVEWLREALDGDPIQANELQRMAKDSGYAWATVRRAKESAGAISRRIGIGPTAHWEWRLDGAKKPMSET